jgi:hypothetical protein
LKAIEYFFQPLGTLSDEHCLVYLDTVNERLWKHRSKDIAPKGTVVIEAKNATVATCAHKQLATNGALSMSHVENVNCKLLELHTRVARWFISKPKITI